MSRQRIKPPYGAIWNLLKDGLVVPFLGAGASSIGRAKGSHWDPQRPLFLPRGGELSAHLAEESSFPSAAEVDRKDLAKVSAFYEYTMSRPRLRQRLRSLLHHEYAPGDLHLFLAQVPVHLIIVTTNYDRLIEDAFTNAGKAFDLVIYPTDPEEYSNAVLVKTHGSSEFQWEAPQRLNLDLGQSSVIFKMHGNIDVHSEKQDSFVITEDDYIQFLTRMANQAAVPAWFIEQFRNRSFLFLGYGLQDWNLRVVLNSLSEAGKKGGRGELTSWAIQYRPNPLEQSLWQNRKIFIYDQPLEEFTEEMWKISGLPRPKS